MFRQIIFMGSAFALLILSCGSAPGQDFALWRVDPCDKVFSDTTPGETDAVSISAAANEYESIQIGLRSDSDLKGVSVAVSPLVSEETGAEITADNIRTRVVGTIPLEHNTPYADAIITRKAPCDMPDVLYERSSLDLAAGVSQSVWITLYVPKGTKAGKYAGEIVVACGDLRKTLPVELEVWPFELSDARSLYATNWWFPWNIKTQYDVEYLGEEHWKILEEYFKNMRDHRQNVLLVPWQPSGGSFVSARRSSEGVWTFDFTRLERLLDLMAKYGLDDRIELGHIGGIDRTEHVVRFSGAEFFNEATKQNETATIDEWLEPALKATCDLLRERGVFDRAVLHIADEPYIPDIDSWREASERVRKIEPSLKQIDAIETINFSGRLDVWVPKLSHFDRWRSAFEARRDQGEFWFYICCHPYGVTYPNRFMDIPGARVRSLHWINYSEKLPGYLHWGYNYWKDAPFGPPPKSWGPGDSHVVYPGEKGPLDSIRWEIERDSIEDFEYLKLLERSVAAIKETLDPEKAWFVDPESRAMELARRVVPDLKHATMDPDVISETRREIAREIVNATGDLKLVVQTFPEDRSVAAIGPALHELYGYATPGASVTVRGKEVPVDPDGFFKVQLDLGDGETVVETVATLNGKTARTTRVFYVE